jgi:hypothetical protein
VDITVVLTGVELAWAEATNTVVLTGVELAVRCGGRPTPGRTGVRTLGGLPTTPRQGCQAGCATSAQARCARRAHRHISISRYVLTPLEDSCTMNLVDQADRH